MRTTLVVALLLFLAITAPAQRRRGHDPLTASEADQLRDVAQEPPKRIKLIIKFAQARMQAIEQLRGDPKLSTGRGKQIHDLLEDFTAIIDELDDNINMYAKRKEELVRPLGDVITADSEFQLKLRGLKQASEADPKVMAEAKDYQFVLENAIDSVNSNLDNARDLQDEIAKAKQDTKKKSKDKN